MTRWMALAVAVLYTPHGGGAQGSPTLEQRVAALETSVTNLDERVTALEPTPTPTPTPVATATPSATPPPGALAPNIPVFRATVSVSGTTTPTSSTTNHPAATHRHAFRSRAAVTTCAVPNTQD